jgi:CRISPR-associated protein Cmr3
MAIWIIEPHDSLIFRDGRPFGPNPGARATTLPFPFPSTTTGGVRTRAGLENGVFKPENSSRVKDIGVRGPLLVQLSQQEHMHNIVHWMVPAPGDALLFEHQETEHIDIKQLVPVLPQDNAQTDFTQKNTENLCFVGLEEPDSRKPAKDAPRYWYWGSFESWLLNPATVSQQTTQVHVLGQNGPQLERRLHVSINPETGTALDGALFETSGLEFTHGKQVSQAERLALAVEVDEDGQGNKIEPGLAHLGGERRVVSWRKSDRHFPACLPEVEDAVAGTGACRLFLLTPAYFTKGYLPTQLRQPRDGVTPELRAIAIQRPQIVSGWDLDKREPKPTRRLAPAGTVLFLHLKGEKGAIRTWVKRIWMQCVSDEPQDCRDGFGLAALGTWSGKAITMK